ncbi:MAG: ABC transporter substrate-binding protein [Bacteroidetes bacterium MedPE-SWsnd-G2]|nr:MAG: ABC transporter substrate-binding protein [Bacteroidetes bacterium MedPE-SWsnd-G2]
MLKRTITLLLILVSIGMGAQDFSTLWKGHFSYLEIKDIAQSENKIYAASENAVFSYDLFSNELETITTVEGLSGETISTITYSQDYNLLVIGYENGLIEIASGEDNDILSVVDILEKETISPSLKQINHFNEHEGLLYISTDYGISVYNLEALEFGDSYFIGNGGAQIEVRQSTVFDGYIYAACKSGSGMRRAELDNANLIDFNEWQQITGGNFEAVQAVEDKLYAVRSNKIIYEVINTTFNQLFTYESIPLDVREANSNLMVTTKDDAYVYDANFVLQNSIALTVELDTQFTCAALSGGHIYLGSEDLGVLKTDVTSGVEFFEIKPEGPYSNNAFKINAETGEVWISYGEYDDQYNPYPLNSEGISHLVEEEWTNIPFDSLLGARELNTISPNPFNPSQVFISSFVDGILEINGNTATTLFDHTNSGLESLVLPNNPSFINIRVSGADFDRNGVLWSVTTLVQRPLKSYDPSTGSWQDYNFEALIGDPLADEIGYNDVVVGANGTKWIAGFYKGVIGFNEDGNNLKNIFTAEQGFPSPDIRALAMDNRNQLWIGTRKGLRVLFNTSNFFQSTDIAVSEIVILEEGLPKELLESQFISDIKVDGSNNKWVGTLSSGVFYFSPDGQRTIYHFTKDNSPLPSNTINDISVDGKSGRVYIATSKGLVSFLSGGSETSDALEDAYVYPNPVRPEYNILGFDDLNNITNGVKVKGLTDNVNIKITDIEGNLVAEAQSNITLRSSVANYNFAIDGGTAIWNGKNLANNVVASGVYLILISDLDSFETKVLKLLIIR